MAAALSWDSLARGNRTFVLAAHLIAGHLEGKVSNLGGEFPFTATIDGDQMQLQANGKTFNLARQNSARGLGGMRQCRQRRKQLRRFARPGRRRPKPADAAGRDR